MLVWRWLLSTFRDSHRLKLKPISKWLCHSVQPSWHNQVIVHRAKDVFGFGKRWVGKLWYTQFHFLGVAFFWLLEGTVKPGAGDLTVNNPPPCCDFLVHQYPSQFFWGVRGFRSHSLCSFGSFNGIAQYPDCKGSALKHVGWLSRVYVISMLRNTRCWWTAWFFFNSLNLERAAR